MLHQCLPWQTNRCLRAETGQTRLNVNQRMISVLPASAPGILHECSGGGAGNAVARQEGFFYLSIGGEGRNLVAHALLTRRLRARKLETSFEPQPQSDFSSDPDPGNMPCKCWSPVLHSARSVLGQIKPKQKLHFWPARVHMRSLRF